MNEDNSNRNIGEAQIGVFDSGVGGLSVLRSIRTRLPNASLLYFADQIHVPYGSRSLEEVRGFSEKISRFLLGMGVKLIVVACNTASAAALHHLRMVIPEVPFVGMEPAIKPAAETTSTGVVGVLATPATFQGTLFTSMVERYGRNVVILQSTCPGLVTQIEKGLIDHPETLRILKEALTPMLARNIDKVVLGCTHYPFVIDQIQTIVGSSVQVIDPAPAVARQTERKSSEIGLSYENQSGNTTFLTSGDPGIFDQLINQLVGIKAQSLKATWTRESILQI